MINFVLAATDEQLASAWKRHFRDLEFVRIHQGSIFEVDCEAIVSPANSFGFMDGGIDALYCERWGQDLQQRLRRLIMDKHRGELLVGEAEMVATENGKHPTMIAAPTMRVPMVLDDKNNQSVSRDESRPRVARKSCTRARFSEPWHKCAADCDSGVSGDGNRCRTGFRRAMCSSDEGRVRVHRRHPTSSSFKLGASQ